MNLYNYIIFLTCVRGCLTCESFLLRNVLNTQEGVFIINGGRCS